MTALEKIQKINEQIDMLRLQLRPLYYDFLSEEVSRIIEKPLVCKEISQTVISYERKLRQIEFVDECGNTFAKCVDLCYDDNTGDRQECFMIGMDEDDASDVLTDMMYSVDWDIF